jgi:hypothetical protein
MNFCRKPKVYWLADPHSLIHQVGESAQVHVWGVGGGGVDLLYPSFILFGFTCSDPASGVRAGTSDFIETCGECIQGYCHCRAVSCLTHRSAVRAAFSGPPRARNMGNLTNAMLLEQSNCPESSDQCDVTTVGPHPLTGTRITRKCLSFWIFLNFYFILF